jgi:hypothetical protein
LSPRLTHAALLGAAVLVGSAAAAGAAARSTVSEVPLPGGIRAAQAAVGDRTSPDRAQFLFDFIRRTYDSPFDPKGDPRQAALQSLLAALEAGDARSDSSETVPLPLSEKIWIDAVFGGRATPRTLVAEILKSRGAALFYCGLLSLDDETRAWMATEPALVAELASRHAAEFLAAAPGLQITAAGARLPGGPLAASAWEALAGRTPEEPAAFVRALVAADRGRLARFVGTLGQLTPAQVRVALGLVSPDAEARVASARRLYSVHMRLSRGFEPAQSAFARPALDPALLVSELGRDENGQPLLPGSRGFWTQVFAGSLDGAADVTPRGSRAAPEPTDPPDFAWLCEQVFKDDPGERRRRYTMVLFASRRLARDPAADARDAVDAVRAAGEYPALARVLERAGVEDLATFASAVRRAASLSRIADHRHAARALAQFQGALALITHAASRRSLAAGPAHALVSSLSEVPLSASGDYEGRLAHWLRNWMAAEAEARALAPQPAEDLMVRVLAGTGSSQPRFIEWEGTRYRLDLAAAEASRLARALGDPPNPWLSSAVTAAAMADAPANRSLADDLLARGLAETAYAAAVGPRDGVSLSAAELAGRHDFGLGSRHARHAPWRLPSPDTDAEGRWHVHGALLGLDVALADFSLLRFSSRVLPHRPSLDAVDRRVLIEAVALVDAAALSDPDRDAIAAAIQAGRARLGAAHSALDVDGIAEGIALGPLRRTLLAWTMLHDPHRVPAFLSPSELFWLGRGASRAEVPQAWGAPAGPRQGCHCLQFARRRSREIVAGRRYAGMMASAFPDLNLRLAELLAELRMPAALLGPVLRSASLEFVNGAISRDPDDWRGPVEFVQALGPEHLEQYLALLTTDGPLVPAGPAEAGLASGSRVTRAPEAQSR